MTEGSIRVTDIIDNPDGSATMTFDLSEADAKIMTSYGLRFVLTCAAYNVTLEEAFNRIAGRSE